MDDMDVFFFFFRGGWKLGCSWLVRSLFQVLYTVGCIG